MTPVLLRTTFRREKLMADQAKLETQLIEDEAEQLATYAKLPRQTKTCWPSNNTRRVPSQSLPILFTKSCPIVVCSGLPGRERPDAPTIIIAAEPEPTFVVLHVDELVWLWDERLNIVSGGLIGGVGYSLRHGSICFRPSQEMSRNASGSARASTGSTHYFAHEQDQRPTRHQRRVAPGRLFIIRSPRRRGRVVSASSTAANIPAFLTGRWSCEATTYSLSMRAM
jgi:hypothetical protein